MWSSYFPRAAADQMARLVIAPAYGKATHSQARIVLAKDFAREFLARGEELSAGLREIDPESST